MADRPPNIVVFMSDQERADVVKKGHPCISPAAERLAEEGLLFDRCYTPTAHSCPARGCYFTGLYPSHHGIWNNILTHTTIDGRISPGCRMFSENMRDAGWNLGITGKWHCSRTENPEDRGWEEVRPTATARNKTTRDDFWQKQMQLAHKPEPEGPRQRGEILMPGYGRKLLYGTTDRAMEDNHDYKVVTAAIEAMERYAKEDKPFFVHVGPVTPHDPYIVPQKYLDMYDGVQVELPASFHDDLQDKPRIYQRHRKQLWSQLSEEEVKESIVHYWAYCTMLDDYRQMVYDAVDDLGLRDNTILIFMSDHGDYLGDHGLYCKGVPAFDSAVRVPFIVRWPEGIEDPGRVIDEFVTLCDFAPTFLDVAGLGQNPTSGASVAPFFNSGEVEGWREEVHFQFSGVELYYTQRTVMTREYKYVFNGFDFDELYDLSKDPETMTNLIDDPGYQDVLHDMVKRMWRFSYEQRDITGNAYFTVALAPLGPHAALREMEA